MIDWVAASTKNFSFKMSDKRNGIKKAVTIVLKGYPRLSETFIAQEIRSLEEMGLDVRIASLRMPTDEHRHPVHDEIKAPVNYLPEFPMQEEARVQRAWEYCRQQAGYARAWETWRADYARDPSQTRMRNFLQAMVLASETASDVGRFHAHFMHFPGSVARYASMICDLPWSCSAHARDIWTSPEWEKVEKLNDLDWLVTCTAYGHRHLESLADDPEKVALVYHGLDFDRLPAVSKKPTSASDDEQVTILSVGRAVEKKGYDTLLHALSLIPAELNWRFMHIGGGALLPDLKTLSATLGISVRVEWCGAQPQEAVFNAYQQSDVFVLASRVAKDGDMDGLPNVMMEAQSQGLACVSTNVSAIPELVIDGKTGLLVPPENPNALADAITRLIEDAEFRQNIATAGEQRVRKVFSHHAGLLKLAEKFGLDIPVLSEPNKGCT